MAQITITPSACTASAAWQDQRYYGNNSGLRQLVFTLPHNETLGGGGVNITGITLRGYVRNSASAAKRLLYGYKSSTGQAPGAWAQVDGVNVNDYAFTAASSSNGSYKYFNVVRALSGAPLERFVAHMRAQFAAGSPVYLGVIQPDQSKSIQVQPSLGNWTVTVTYELLGNVPTTNITSAVLGESSIVTTINKVVEQSSTTLRYKIGDTVLQQKDIGTSVSDTYIVPSSAGQYFPTQKTATLTIEAETFVGGESYGVVTTSVTLTLPDGAKPTATCALTRTWVTGVSSEAQINAYVQTKSGVSFALTGTANYGATVSTFTVSIEGKSYTRTGNGSIAHSPLSGSGTIAYTYSVTDSRGQSNTYSGTLSVLAWSAPKITQFSIARVTENDELAIDGIYARASASASVSSLMVNGAEENALTYFVQYRETGTSEWTDTDSITAADTSVTQTWQLKNSGAQIDSFNDMAGYDFQLVVRDIYSTSTALDDMPTKEVFLDINETTGSMGFGGEASDDANVVRYDFYGPVYFRAGVAGGMVYSNKEVDTGNNWIDGRPIYRKVLNILPLAAGATGFASLGYSVAQIDTIISARGFALGPSNNWLKPIPMSDINSAMYSILCDLDVSDQDDMQVRVGCGSSLALPNGGFVIVEYTKSDDNPTYYYLPFLASNNDKGCVASASSIYTAGNQAFGAFNGAIDSWWASAGDDTDRWVQVQMPYALKNMVVTLTDREDVSGDHRRANTAGAFLGSNDGSDWVQLFSFTDRNPNFVNGFATTYQLNNATAYKYLRYAPAAGSYSSGFATSVADIRIEGEVFDAQDT